MELTVATDGAWFSIYCQLKRDQAREKCCPEKKSSSATVSSRLGRKMMVEIAMDTKDICYHGIVVENKIICKDLSVVDTDIEAHGLLTR